MPRALAPGDGDRELIEREGAHGLKGRMGIDEAAHRGEDAEGPLMKLGGVAIDQRRCDPHGVEGRFREDRRFGIGLGALGAAETEGQRPEHGDEQERGDREGDEDFYEGETVSDSPS